MHYFHAKTNCAQTVSLILSCCRLIIYNKTVIGMTPCLIEEFLLEIIGLAKVFVQVFP